MIKKIKKLGAIILTAAMACMLLTGCGEGKDAETNKEGKITFYGVNDLQISAAQIIADKKGFFKEEGLDIECVYMLNVPEIAAIMANGEAKIACANNYSTPTWVLNGANCVTIAPTANMGGTQCLLLRKDISIDSAKDLEGLKMGMVPGSTQYVTFMNMCRDLDVDPTTIESVPLQFADQLSALSQGQIDIMAVPEPWVTKAQEEAGAQLLCSGTESYIKGAEGEVVWCNMYACINVQKDWMDNNKETIKKILLAIEKATKFINENREEAVTILAKQIGMSEEDTAKIMEENVYVYGVDDEYVDTSIALEEFMVGEKITPGGKSLPFKDYHDFSILREVSPESYTAAEEY